MDNKSEAKRLAKNTVLIAIGNMGAKLISFFLLPLYTTVLSTSEYGLYDFIITLSYFISPIVSMTIYESLFRFLIEAKTQNDEKKIKSIISSALYINIISIIIYSIISIIVYYIFNVDYISVLTLYIISNVFYTFLISLLRGIDQIKYYALYSSIKNILQVILSCLAVLLLNLGIQGLLYSAIVSAFLICIIIIIHFKIWRYLIIKKEYLVSIKPLIKYSIPLIPDTISSSVISVSDRIFVKQFVSVEANGIYSIAHKFPAILEVIYHFFITAWNESASRVYEKDKTKMKDYYQGLYDFVKKIVIGGVICLIAFMPILFRIFIRGDYTSAFKYVPLLLVAQMLNCIATFFSGILIANKDTKKIANSTIIAAIINIVLNFVFVFKIKIYGVIVATIISNVVLLVLRKINSGHYVVLKENIKYYLASICVFSFVILLYQYDLSWKTIISAILALSFFFFTNKEYIIIMVKYLENKIRRKK